MDNKPQGSSPPPKPWERAGSTSSGPPPFKPPTPGSTSDVVEASGTSRPGEIVTAADKSAAVNRTPLARPVPSRPWEPNTGMNTYGTGVGGYNSGQTYAHLFTSSSLLLYKLFTAILLPNLDYKLLYLFTIPRWMIIYTNEQL